MTQALSVVQLASSASAQLKNDASTNRTDLETITGNADLAADGFLHVVVSASFPEAIAAVLKNTTELNGQQITNVVRNNATDTTSELAANIDKQLASLVGNLFPSSKSASSQLSSAFSQLGANAENLLAALNNGFGSLVENLIERSIHPAFTLLRSAAIKGGETQRISPADLKKIIQYQSVGNTAAAALILQKYSDLPIEELEDVISKINNKASAQLLDDIVTAKPANVFRTDAINDLWKEATTNPNSKVFLPILGQEIGSEVLEMTREVTEIIVTFMPGPGTSVQAFHNKYSTEYAIGFNHHFFIGSDAIIYRGRPLNIEISDTPPSITNDHYKRSISIAVNIDHTSETHKVSPNQLQQLDFLVRQMWESRPGLQIFGADDVGWVVSRNAHATNIPLYFERQTGKKNIADYNPKIAPPLTEKQLAERKL